MPYSIMLDAGHGGTDPGAIYNGLREKDDTLRLVLAIGEILQNRGVDVEYTRTTDIYETPFQKAMEANEAGVDYFVSIHRNSFEKDNVVSGVESLVYDLSGIKYEMAQNINASLETVGFVNLGVKARPNLVVLKRTKMPAVLVEVGFLNSDTDNQLFDDNFDDIALAIAEGILETLPPEEDKRADESQNESAADGDIKNGDAEEKNYRVQVGLYRNWVYAQRLLDRLLADGYPAYLDEADPYIRVQVGPYATLTEAVQMERNLRRNGYDTLVVRDR